ncbi:GntR family transcriptional regulator [uncultured Megasphaera sp.]|uniref:GntR family transcriptional regulator n=1 Tax=uncultured Megasphaera sp. TaxID=165188 RepID=UPI0025D1BC98|nr:GntR family transcriptional regulator [uncultured Megasphaera sp.]
MESGEWPAGTRLPSQRAMARHFQVNRSTLNQALKPLLEAGVLQGRGSQGTVVASTAWSLRLPVQPDWNRYMTAGYFRANQEVVQAINTLEFDDRLIRLGTGELDPRLFPQDAFHQTLRRLCGMWPMPSHPWAMSSRWGCPLCVRLWLGMPGSGT